MKTFSTLNSAKKSKVVALLAPNLGYAADPSETPEAFLVRKYDEKIVADYLQLKAYKRAEEVRLEELKEDNI